MSKDRHTNRRGQNKIDLIKKKFGKLTVLSDTGKRKSRRPIWICRCECGNKVEVLGKYLLIGDTKSCGCISTGNAHNRTGYKELSGSYWYIVVAQAKRRGIPISVTVQEAYERLVIQNWKCALSNEPIQFAVNLRDSRNEQTASLDRKDNNQGYTVNNIQWVHKKVNIMRNTLDIRVFQAWCKKISDFTLTKRQETETLVFES